MVVFVLREALSRGCPRTAVTLSAVGENGDNAERCMIQKKQYFYRCWLAHKLFGTNSTPHAHTLIYRSTRTRSTASSSTGPAVFKKPKKILLEGSIWPNTILWTTAVHTAVKHDLNLNLTETAICRLVFRNAPRINPNKIQNAPKSSNGSQLQHKAVQP